MALSLDAFASASKPKRMQCAVAKVLADLDDADCNIVSAALDDGTITHAAIAKVLVAEGHAITQGVIGRHRKGDCACVPAVTNAE